MKVIWKRRNFMMNNFKLEDRLETLDKMVRSCSFSNQLFLNPKEIKTDLIVLYLYIY